MHTDQYLNFKSHHSKISIICTLTIKAQHVTTGKQMLHVSTDWMHHVLRPEHHNTTTNKLKPTHVGTAKHSRAIRTIKMNLHVTQCTLAS